jgi:hypothetical protein
VLLTLGSAMLLLTVRRLRELLSSSVPRLVLVVLQGLELKLEALEAQQAPVSVRLSSVVAMVGLAALPTVSEQVVEGLAVKQAMALQELILQRQVGPMVALVDHQVVVLPALDHQGRRRLVMGVMERTLVLLVQVVVEGI